jgi:negative regulator of flagellin synthesis FlgM
VIINNPIEGLLKVYGKNRLESPSQIKPSVGVKGSESDTLVLSDEARVLRVTTQALKKVPEIRAEKVEALKNAIQTGNYRVSGTEVAEAMLRDRGI